MQVLQYKIDEWRKELPMIRPYYAIKCNPNTEMINYFVKQGLGFDCASRHEIETVIDLGANSSSIIYAHPVKSISDLKYAYNSGIRCTTFDSLSELEKIKEHAPKMDCIIRLKVDNPTARVQLGLKYGVEYEEYKKLIDYAKDKNINIVGASFHVGSASKEVNVFESGIKYCRDVFDYANDKGFTPKIIDVGGGFTGETFKDCASVIRESILKYKFDTNYYKLMAEPGRYFAEEFMTFFVNVIGQRRREYNEYWISDSLYGSFNCVIFDSQTPLFEVLRHPLLAEYKGNNVEQESIVYCNTCDSMDHLGKVKLPYLRNGDYLMIPNFGAYTLSAACDFNGINMTKPKIFYISNLDKFIINKN